MDVVFNHVSQYDRNPLKCVDTAYWFRLGDDGAMSSASGCGNDLATERPMARRLILDSVRHFAAQYRVGGFRFDLGALIDDETLRQLHAELSSRGLFHTAEPWGGGQSEPETFARLRGCPGLKDIFAMHRNLATQAKDNAQPELTLSTSDEASCQGGWIRLSVHQGHTA